ncbi:MAG: type VI secretion system contractile sheath large subunit [Candidatus Polarisedimenticolaceae bacterium]|nr:type VI secretion system contractile sheath large subunit [Candidatus Polarisedimenticolaceae bacterium]
MSDQMTFEMGFNPTNRTSDQKQQSAMRILLMGDFSGRQNRGVVEGGAALAKRPIRRVDVDNFESRMSDYQPTITLPMMGPDEAPLTLQFNELEDFHPDALYLRLPLFQALRRLRARLADPATFTEAAAELKQTAEASPPAATAAPSAESDDDMFGRLLGQTPGTARAADIDTFIQGIVAPHIVPEVAAEQASYLNSIDEAISSQMRELLHQPEFQALESAWWSVYRLITRLECDESLQIYLLDVSKQELLEDINAAGEGLQNSALYRLLVEQGVKTMGGEAWSVVAGDYQFGSSGDDINLLAALATITQQAGGPFLADAESALIGCQSFASAPSPEMWTAAGPQALHRWQTLRASTIAPWIGLALPRVLQRLPYGANGEEIDSFNFEEQLTAPGEHEGHLWGSAAFACAMLLAEAFQQQGWSMQPGDRLDIDDLPAFTYQTDEGRVLLPGAEALLSERAGEAIMQQGLIPLLSYRNRNMVRVLRFQSVADPLTSLAGPWR